MASKSTDSKEMGEPVSALVLCDHGALKCGSIVTVTPELLAAHPGLFDTSPEAVAYHTPSEDNA